VYWITWLSKMAQFLAETVDAMVAGDGGVCIHVVDDDEEDAQAAREGLAAYQAGETIAWEQVKAELA
jgi:hypothetical protein